jgi:hypothetical protein
MTLPVPGPWTAADDDRHLEWLAKIGNALVYVFRPRLQRLAGGGGRA